MKRRQSLTEIQRKSSANPNLNGTHLLIVLCSFLATLSLLFFMHKLHSYQMGMINAHSDFIDKGCHKRAAEFQKDCWEEIIQARKQSQDEIRLTGTQR